MATRPKPDLAMNWSRTEGGLTIRLEGASTAEGAALAAALNPQLLEFFQSSGFDLATLRFSIRKREAAQKGVA